MRLGPVSPLLLAGLLAGAGITHFARPAFYTPMIPGWLPGGAGVWVAGSGVAELLVAGAVAVPRTRRRAAWAAAALFVVVFPANVTMALESGGHSPAYRLAAYGRLPLQVPLVLWAVRVARR